MAARTTNARARRLTTNVTRLLHHFDEMAVELTAWPLAKGVDPERLNRLGTTVSKLCGRTVSEVVAISRNDPAKLEWVFRLGWKMFSHSPAPYFNSGMADAVSRRLGRDLEEKLRSSVYADTLRIRPVINRQLGDWSGDLAVKNLQESLIFSAATAIVGDGETSGMFTDFCSAYLDGILPFAWANSNSQTFFVIVA